MSNVSQKSSSQKALTYLLIIVCVIAMNIYSNRKYLINSFNITPQEEITLQDSRVKTFLEPETYNKLVKVLSGYSIDSLLMKEDISESLVIASSRALKSVFDPRDLKAGSRVTISYDWRDRKKFLGYEIDLGYDQSVVVKRDKTDNFIANIVEKEYFTKVFNGQGVIDNTLYQSGIESGISPNVIMNLMQLYSFDVDFQRDIVSGTEFEVNYENYLDDRGEIIKHGNILSAVLKIDGTRYPIYRFTTDDGKSDYYNEEGKSARKALLKTPVNGAYISSGFGMRIHPISSYTAFHRGIDFAVRQGTPIYASGDGVISAAVVSNTGYGIHIRIRHPNGYETLYGHMVSHAKGMKVGVKVTQGQIIGYVGSTGNSTGPHLHYETRYNGKFVNPSSIKIPPGRTLEGKELDRFKIEMEKVKLHF
ncbi:M23 family metallopeptidase [Thiospirochaeta perfilievii]|nr:M23 family metallopeptidase [Thiospirochaeta perfilievii]